MSDETNEFATTNAMMDRLASAAWTALATTAPRDMHIDDIAAAAGVDPGAARAVAGSVTNLILHQLSQLDQLAVVESFADIQDAGDVTIREKIMEAITHRFEIYAPYKAQLLQLDSAARRNPELAIRLLDSLVQAMRRILVMAGDDLAGWRGEARVRGVAAVSMLVARVWHKDETPDLSVTMNEIDKRLAVAEEWGRSLRVFASRHHASDESAADTPSSDDPASDNGGYNPPQDERYQ